MITFDELKHKVSIIQVAEDLGYRLKKKDGRTNPCYALYQGSKKVDEILIQHPTDTYTQRFCDRNYHHGDVIEFVKLHIHSWPQFPHHNEMVRISIILKHYAGISYIPKESVRFQEKQEFEPARYDVSEATIENCHFLTRGRQLSSDTVATFLRHIVIIKDQKGKKNIPNIGFPYKMPGTETVTNYEIRNYNFKSMAAGGDASSSVWGVYSRKIDRIFIFESAIDAMSFYELYKDKLTFQHTALVSTGGGLSGNQITNLIKTCNPQEIVCCFDNDKQGTRYRERVESIVRNWNIREDSNIEVDTILPNDKDFNDDLKTTKL